VSAREQSAELVGLHNLAPVPGSRRARKRIGRGEGSGTGKTSGRGQKGAGSRTGARHRATFEGGQMPIHMRMRKLRGPHMKKSMPFEPFRTHTQAVNLGALDSRFEAGTEVTLELMRANGLATRKGRAQQAAERSRARLQRHRARAHRGGGRQLHAPRRLSVTARVTARASSSGVQHRVVRAWQWPARTGASSKIRCWRRQATPLHDHGPCSPPS
jgi:large subunit ribosomal protein L15